MAKVKILRLPLKDLRSLAQGSPKTRRRRSPDISQEGTGEFFEFLRDIRGYLPSWVFLSGLISPSIFGFLCVRLVDLEPGMFISNEGVSERFRRIFFLCLNIIYIFVPRALSIASRDNQKKVKNRFIFRNTILI